MRCLERFGLLHQRPPSPLPGVAVGPGLVGYCTAPMHFPSFRSSHRSGLRTRLSSLWPPPARSPLLLRRLPPQRLRQRLRGSKVMRQVMSPQGTAPTACRRRLLAPLPVPTAAPRAHPPAMAARPVGGLERQRISMRSSRGNCFSTSCRRVASKDAIFSGTTFRTMTRPSA